jgi:hypothetical protein
VCGSSQDPIHMLLIGAKDTNGYLELLGPYQWSLGVHVGVLSYSFSPELGEQGWRKGQVCLDQCIKETIQGAKASP